MTVKRDPSNESLQDRSPTEDASARDTYPEQRRRPIDIGDVAALLLDRGVVLDSYLQGAAIGLEIWTADSQMTIASLDTYLRFADSADQAGLAGGAVAQ